MELISFLERIKSYENMKFDELVTDDAYRVTVKCGDNIVLRHVIIKCDCETAESIKRYVYEQVANALFELGIDKINEKCKQ